MTRELSGSKRCVKEKVGRLGSVVDCSTETTKDWKANENVELGEEQDVKKGRQGSYRILLSGFLDIRYRFL